jgi:hypothetical protein
LQVEEEFLADAVQRAVTELKILLWGVYDHRRYAVHEFVSDEGDTDLYVVYDRPPSEEPVGHVRRYAPFVETPHLFLTFARLADEEITREHWKDWTRRYGVLGLQRYDPRLKHGRWKGGPAETFSAFKEEACEANETLKLYEAASNPDGPDVDYIKQFGEARGITFEDSSSRRPLNAGAFRQGAQYMVFARVRRKLREECYMDLDMTNDGAFGLSLGFHSLLGAMYLQLAFLMRNTVGVRYCRAPNCNKIISFDAPQETPEERLERLSRLSIKGRRKPQKRRSDKEFCDKACYMRWKRRNDKHDAARQ